jgi:hypothetical protein
MEDLLEYIDGLLCIRSDLLYSDYVDAKGNVVPAMMTRMVYDNCVCGRRRTYTIVSGRKACKGRKAMVVWGKLDGEVKEYLMRRLGGNPYELVKQKSIADYVKPDLEAAKFFENYRKANGEALSQRHKRQYIAEACILNAYLKLMTDKKNLKRAYGGGSMEVIKQKLSESVNGLKEYQVKTPDTCNTRHVKEYQVKTPDMCNTTYNEGLGCHSLPANSHRLYLTAMDYKRYGYEYLISGSLCNTNSKKVNDKVERLICSIHGDDKINFNTRTSEIYHQFLYGEVTLADSETGEIFNPEDFKDAEGSPIVLSIATVTNILNNPRNAQMLAKKRINTIDFNTKQVAYSHRHRPNFTLSKISMDDRTLSRKTTKGEWVNAYLATDLGSECILSCVFDVAKPNVDMIMECFRELYKTSMQYGLKWAGEVEVENHLMRKIEPTLNGMFDFVTFCNPGNSKQKGAEHIIRMLKYFTEKQNHKGIGRYYGKGAYKTKSEHKDDDYKQERLPYDTIVADAKQDIWEHNHKPHSRYPNKTRWQVLVENMNEQLSYPSAERLLKYIGNRTETTIRNNDFVRVQYEDYYIERIDNINRLQPGNYKVDAYWLPKNERELEVCLYQGDRFIGMAIKYERYNEAKIERTDKDEAIRLEQIKRQEHQRKLVKDGVKELVNVAVIKNNNVIDEVDVRIIEHKEPMEEVVAEEYSYVVQSAEDF